MKVEFPSSEAENIFNTFSQCPNCQVNSLEFVSGDFPNTNFICQSCGQVSDLFEVLQKILPEEEIECPECGAFDVIEGVCFDCGYELEEGRDYEREKELERLMEKND